MLNSVSIMGRLVRDPELKTVNNDTSIASFTIAVDRDRKGKNGEDKQVDFFDCVAWRSTAEFVSKYFAKGSLIIVNGELQTESWETADGTKRKKTSIVARNVYFGGSKGSNDGGQRSNQSAMRQMNVADDSDFPF